MVAVILVSTPWFPWCDRSISKKKLIKSKCAINVAFQSAQLQFEGRKREQMDLIFINSYKYFQYFISCRPHLSHTWTSHLHRFVSEWCPPIDSRNLFPIFSSYDQLKLWDGPNKSLSAWYVISFSIFSPYFASQTIANSSWGCSDMFFFP